MCLCVFACVCACVCVCARMHMYVLNILGNILHVLLVYRVVMVVGAGRGPLVTATLKAATEARRIVRVYAVEKNANAIVT